MGIAEYWINRAKKAKGYESDNQIAKDIGINSGILSRIKNKEKRMSPNVCEYVSDATGCSYALVMFSIMADKSADERDREAFFEIIERAYPHFLENEIERYQNDKSINWH